MHRRWSAGSRDPQGLQAPHRIIERRLCFGGEWEWEKRSELGTEVGDAVALWESKAD